MKHSEEIQQIELLNRDQQTASFGSVNRFLVRFGYLKECPNNENELCEQTAQALETYQIFNRITPTGAFDYATRSAISRPRCAHDDEPYRLAEASVACAWEDVDELTYTFDIDTEDLPAGAAFDAVRRAFSTWDAQLPFPFREVTIDDNPDIRVGWREASEADSDLTGPAIAHADFPPPCSIITNSLPKPINFDETEVTWSIGAEPGKIDVETVALHEIGHILGLKHSTDAASIMRPEVMTNFTQHTLAEDDISGVERLYPRPVIPTPPTSPPTSDPTIPPEPTSFWIALWRWLNSLFGA